MFRNYIISALRQLKRNSWISVINIAGLAVGLAVCIIIGVYINFEIGYNRFHENGHRIYRVSQHIHMGDQHRLAHTTHAPLGPLLRDEFPEIEYMVRLNNQPPRTFLMGDDKIRVDRVVVADSCLFRMFSFGLIAGDPSEALTQPGTLVLTRSTSERLFGRTNPVGRTINTAERSYIISGVVNDPPENSSIRFDILEPFETLYESGQPPGWGVGIQYTTFLQLRENSDYSLFEEKTREFMDREVNKLFGQVNAALYLLIEPLDDIYLFSEITSDPVRGSIDNLKIFSAIALVILIIASLNYVNLSSAKTIRRMKEVSVRKLTGASDRQLITQFIGESVVTVLLSFFLALVIAEILMPHLSIISGKQLSMTVSGGGWLLWILSGILLLTVTITGSGQAYFIASAGNFGKTGQKYQAGERNFLQNMLVLLQFSVSVILITGSVIIYSQLLYMQEGGTGFDHKDLLVVNLSSNEAREKWEVIKTEVSNINGVENVSAVSNQLGVWVSYREFLPGRSNDATLINYFSADNDLPDVLGIDILKGRGFEPGAEGQRDLFIVNEEFIKMFGVDDPVGYPLRIPMGDAEPRRGSIIGVIQDFNYKSKHHPVEPVVYTISEIPYRHLMVRPSEGISPDLLQSLASVWDSIIQSEPFDYELLEYLIKNEYGGDGNLALLVAGGTALALVIACLGLLALAVSKAESRRKEIGIRKANGAGTVNIVVMLLRDFTKWVFLANIIAVPIAWLIMRWWLQNFPDPVPATPFMFIIPAITSWLLALLTVASTAGRAAGRNPVLVLRDE